MLIVQDLVNTLNEWNVRYNTSFHLLTAKEASEWPLRFQFVQLSASPAYPYGGQIVLSLRWQGANFEVDYESMSEFLALLIEMSHERIASEQYVIN